MVKHSKNQIFTLLKHIQKQLQQWGLKEEFNKYQRLCEFIGDRNIKMCAERHNEYLKKYKTIEAIIQNLRMTLISNVQQMKTQKQRIKQILRVSELKRIKQLSHLYAQNVFGKQAQIIKFQEINQSINCSLKFFLRSNAIIIQQETKKTNKSLLQLYVPIQLLLIFRRNFNNNHEQQISSSSQQQQSAQIIIDKFKRNSIINNNQQQRRKTFKPQIIKGNRQDINSHDQKALATIIQQNEQIKLNKIQQKQEQKQEQEQEQDIISNDDIAQLQLESIEENNDVTKQNSKKVYWTKPQRIKLLIFLNIHKQNIQDYYIQKNKISFSKECSKYIKTNKTASNCRRKIAYLCAQNKLPLIEMIKKQTQQLQIPLQIIERERNIYLSYQMKAYYQPQIKIQAQVINYLLSKKQLALIDQGVENHQTIQLESKLIVKVIFSNNQNQHKHIQKDQMPKYCKTQNEKIKHLIQINIENQSIFELLKNNKQTLYTSNQIIMFLLKSFQVVNFSKDSNL